MACKNCKDCSCKTFEIPIIWRVSGTMKIKAHSLEDAMATYLQRRMDMIPSGGDYIDGSIYLGSADDIREENADI